MTPWTFRRGFVWNTGALCTLALVAGCGGGGTEPKVPAAITVSPPSLSFTAIGQTQQLSPTITDAQGNPVTGVSISWSSDNAGVASVSSSGLVTSHGNGSAQITAQAGSASAIVQVDVVAFNIDVRFLGSATSSQRLAFANAESRWESLIIGDLEDVQLSAGPSQCGDGSPAINEDIDDLLILVTLDSIDGPGNVLGSAGPCFVRNTDGLSVLGAMVFDTTDLQDVESAGLLNALILHEMGHVLGFGSLWPTDSLLVDPSLDGGLDPHFIGSQAVAAFNSIGGSGYTGAKVPVEDTGGEGTADGHWRESVFGNELMTGFVDLGENPLSIVTVASLADEGYTVNLNGADPYSLLLSLRASRSRPRVDRPGVELRQDVLRLPIRKVDRRGNVTGLFRR
jgi:Leishmanolysin/Bacterial Ig-like domain (group 2)